MHVRIYLRKCYKLVHFICLLSLLSACTLPADLGDKYQPKLGSDNLSIPITFDVADNIVADIFIYKIIGSCNKKPLGHVRVSKNTKHIVLPRGHLYLKLLWRNKTYIDRSLQWALESGIEVVLKKSKQYELGLQHKNGLHDFVIYSKGSKDRSLLINRCNK